MLGWFAETTMVAAALAAVAALAGRVRPIGPTARHVLWLAVLVKLVTPPVVSWPWAVDWRDLNWPALAGRAEATSHTSAVEVVEADVCSIPTPNIPHVSDDEPAADLAMPHPPMPPRRAAGPAAAVVWAAVERTLFAGWLVATGLLAAGQGWRILRFRRRLRMGVPAPDDLVAEAERIAAQLGGRVPELLVVPELGSPMLWCLGRPRLLLPAPLVKTINRDRWRGILAHELAHLRRGDHWISRLELLAGLLWWWNPLYWMTRARLDAEAELACDAWVVWALPKDRLAYAETLFDIGSRLSRAVSPAPALGAAGSGRFLERRLTMILRERVPCRVSPAVLLAAILLILLALPSWSAMTPVLDPAATTAPAFAATGLPTALVALTDDDGDDDDDDDDDDAAVRAKKRAEAQAKRAEARAERDEARAKRAEARAKAEADARAKADPKPKPKPKPKAKAQPKPKVEADVDVRIDAFGKEFEKKMEAFGKEMESKFGPGSEFEAQMKKLEKEMESKFGPDSDFEAQMKKLGEEMKSKFGPGSAFEAQMKNLGEDMGAKFGPGSEFEKKMKEMGGKMKEKGGAVARKAKAEADAQADRAKKSAAEKDKVKVGAKDRRRAARVAAIEAQIRKLTEELEALENEEDDDER